MPRKSTDSPNSPGYRQMTPLSHTTPLSAGGQFVGGFQTQTTDPAPKTSRPRAYSTSGHTVVTSVSNQKHQDRNTWSAGSTPHLVQKTSSIPQRPPSAAGYSQSQTNLQLHRSPSNSPTTPANTRGVYSTTGRNQSQANLQLQRSPSNSPTAPADIQRTASNLSNHIPSTISRRFSRSAPIRPRPILFYHKHEPHYGFTNFSNHAVKFEDRVYPTSEHLFQSLKFAHRPLLAEHIRTCDPRPSVAFSEARRFQPEVRQDWGQFNITAMDMAIWFKFTQHRDLREELLATGDADLIENSDKDAFWGCGADGKGKNELGKALVRLRAKLRG